MSTNRRFSQIISIIVVLTMMLSGFQSPPASAQGGDDIKREVNPQTGKVSFIGPESGRTPLLSSKVLGISRPADPALALAKRFAPEFGVQNPERDLTAAQSKKTDEGRTTVKYQQSFEGIPVMGGELIVNTNENGDLYSMNGEVSPDLSLSTQSTIDPEEAKQTALQAVAKWYQVFSDDLVASEPELWIFDESLLHPSTRPVELVWRMEVTPKETGIPVRELVLVNAERGSISLHFNQIDNVWGDAQQEKTSKVEVSKSEVVAPKNNPPTIKNPMPNLLGNTWYVATTGDDANDCATPSTPCATINGTIGKATNGDTILIAGGTYTGPGLWVVYNTKANITLSGGWDNTFSAQSGFSVIDGQNTRAGVFGTGVIDHFIITRGYSSNSGGGIAAYGTLSLNNSIVINNKSGGGSTGSAGGIFSAGDLFLNNSTVRDNISGSGGGGIHMYSDDMLTLNNSTITGNQAASAGGGILLNNSSQQTINIINSTIAYNAAKSGGGIFVSESGRIVSIKNSIIANNTASGNGSDCFGVINILDHSLIGNIDECAAPSGVDNLFNTDPLISAYPVGIFGYHALLLGSPTIDTGFDCLPNDQRGITRPQGDTCDMGSYEYTIPSAAASFGISFGSNQRAGSLFPFPSKLAVYVIDNFGSPVSGINVTFTAPIVGASGTFDDSGTNTTTAITNDSGLAITPIFTANSQLGTYNIVTAVSGLPGSTDFTLSNAALFVSPTGDDSNSCAVPELPCLTINAAISKAGIGDTIKVAGGTYTGSSPNSSVVRVTKSLTISGGWDNSFTAQTDMSIIDGEQTNVDILVSNNNEVIAVTLENFILQYGRRGIINSGQTLTISNSQIANNHTMTYYEEGGGIYNFGGITTVNNSAIYGNSAYGGGGLANDYLGTLIVNNSTINGNSATYYGGGGIRNASGTGTVIINNSTISNNTTSSTGGGIVGPSTIKNTILYGNTATTSPDCSGVKSAGNNIIGDTKKCAVTAESGDQFNADPMLGNFLPAKGYQPLKSNSPAINAGNLATCLPTDQRGASRVGICDIGAYEYNSPGVSIIGGTPQTTALNIAFPKPFQVLVIDDSNNAIGNALVTFTAPSSGPSGIFENTGTFTTTANTDENGVAIAPVFTANNLAGTYLVTPAVNGLTTLGNFNLTNIQVPAKTYTTNNLSTLPGELLCDQTDPNCSTGDDHAKKAHGYVTGVYELYKYKYNRNSIDNNGMTIISTVHYKKNYANAFWDGTQLVFGDAYGFPLADDIVAHEYTHGVTQYESNLFYFYQSGAINESFSDLWGEYYDQTNGLGNDASNVRWLIGEDVTGLGAMRNMKNPSQFGDPDKMTSSKYYKGLNDNGGVHTNSGVNNKAVFLMVDGGTFNDKTVTGIGWTKTAVIYYEANTNLLTSGSDYSDLYYALQQACINVTGQVGITSDDCIQVKNALLAVEMNKQPSSNFNPDAAFCPTNMSTDPSLTLYSDDFESGDDNWNAQNVWSLDEGYATSATHMVYGDDGNPRANSSLTMSSSVSLPVGSKVFLHFRHAFLFDYTAYQGKNYYYDGGVLEYSIDNGNTWKDAKPLFSSGQNYKGTIYNYSGTANKLKGGPAFVGDSHGYVSSRYNLSSLAGKDIQFRWRLGTDQYVSFLGWFVDDVQIYTCIPLPSKPVLKSPASNVLVKDYTPDLDWSDATPTPDHYQLQIATDSKFNSLVYDETSLPTSDFTVPVDLDPNTKYYWRARAFNSLNYPGAWSKAFSFRAVMLPPVLLTPTDEEIITSRKPILDWDNVAGATKYNIQVSTKQTFSTKLFDASPTNSTYKIPSNLPSGKTIYWRVRAIGPNGPSDWSTFSFVTP